jgi:hypothetical protein
MRIFLLSGVGIGIDRNVYGFLYYCQLGQESRASVICAAFIAFLAKPMFVDNDDDDSGGI